MKVSNRQRHILEVLLSRRGDVTAGQLAQEVRISSRTVHRELQELEPVLDSYGISLVKKSGVGISLEGNENNLIRFQEDLRRSETETYSPEERKVLILCRLLDEEEPVKLFSLAREVQAAIPTVSRDLDELEPQLEKSGLALVRKRGYGVEIAGSESTKRQFIEWMAEDYLDPSDFFGVSSSQSDQWPVIRRLLDLVGQDTFLAIEQSIWQQGEQWLKALQETDYTRLLIRLSVAVIRMKRGHRIQSSFRSASNGRKGQDDAGRLAESLGLALPEEEMDYLQSLFDQAREKAADVSSLILEKYGVELAEKTVDLIRSVERRTEIPFSKDRSLLDGLIRHLGPAMERLRKGEAVRNPLLPQIKKDYDSLFAAVRQSVNETWTDIVVPDEEIGYLAMHFGAAAERSKLTPGNIKALLVCTSGIGSSKLLAVRINKEIPQVDLVGLFSWYEASRIPQDQYDLIITTVDLPVEPDRYVKLSPFLTHEETEKLRSRIRGMTSIRRAASATGQTNGRGAWERLRVMKSYTSEMVSIMERFQVYSLENDFENGNLISIMASLLNMLSPKSALQHKEVIVQQLADRELQGSVLIPDTELALFHTRSEWVRDPVVALFRLKVPLRLEHDAKAKQVLLMLAPKTLNKQALEVLSEISAMLLLPEMIRMLEEGDADGIRAFVSRSLEDYLKTKLEWREHHEHFDERKNKTEREGQG